MAKAKNIVVDGEFKGKPIIVHKDCATINAGAFKKIALNTDNVTEYSVVTEDHQKSASSGIAKGIVGGAIFGPLGAIAGGVSGKTRGIYKLIITFRNGAQSLIEVDEGFYGMIIDRLAMVQHQEPVPEQQSAAAPFSAADEILKYKNLMDSGVITEAEFERKKQQLLNM